MKHLLSTLIVLLISGSLFAQTISIQGVLRDPNGRSVDDGFHSVTFKMYDAATGGAALWTDTYANLETKHGVFQVNLGENTTLDGLAFDKAYYVGVKVENFAEMTPRIQLTIYPYSKAILGQDNKFPSTGNVVLARDSIIVQQGALKFEGANGRIVFNDGTSLNTANFGGPASSLLNPSDLNINADNAADGLGAINFQIAGQTKASILNDGSASFYGSLLNIGEDDITGAFLNLNGAGTGSAGGILNFRTAADYTGNIRKYYMQANGNDLIFGTQDGAGVFTTRWTMTPVGDVTLAGQLNVAGSALRVGQNDNVTGYITVYGAGYGLSNGGQLSLFTAADHTATISRYYFDVIGTSLNIGNENGAGAFTSRMTFSAEGNVGIGDETPTEGRLVVRGSGDVLSNTVAYLSQAGIVGVTAVSYSYDIYANGKIATSEINVWSDARIKKILAKSDNTQDLEKLTKIEIVDYEYIDKIDKGTNVYKKVIAQQVEEVYPLAVSKSSDFIPSVYELADKVKYNAEHQTLKISTEKLHDFTAGDMIRLKVNNKNGQLETEVVKVINKHTFIVAVDKSYDKVFVYGKRVDDFRAVDYEAISMLNVSATQELAKRSENQEKRIAQLEAENVTLKTKLAKVDVLEARLNALMGLDDNTASIKKDKTVKK